jgi:hypothetical protein
VEHFRQVKNRTIILFIVTAAVLIPSVFSVLSINVVQAETGKGKDIFKVIMTIFGADKSKGDLVAIMTVNNGEASKVKFMDTEAFQSSNLSTPAPSTLNPAAEAGIMEWVATFPNVTVNAGDGYKACVIPVKTLEPICKTGNNSPALRPEFVDVSLNEASGVQQATIE